MKKVMFMINGLSGGGAEQILQTLLVHLNYDKYDVTVYSMHRENIAQMNYPKEIHYKVVFDEGIQYPDMMISTVVPYKEFFNSIDKDAHTLILENEKVREIQRDGIAEYGPPKRYLDRVWTQVNAEQKRLSLQKIYDDVCLERIREVYARGDYEETYRILKPWQEMNQYCKDNKLNREDFIVNPKLDQLVEELGLGFGLPS